MGTQWPVSLVLHVTTSNLAGLPEQTSLVPTCMTGRVWGSEIICVWNKVSPSWCHLLLCYTTHSIKQSSAECCYRCRLKGQRKVTAKETLAWTRLSPGPQQKDFEQLKSTNVRPTNIPFAQNYLRETANTETCSLEFMSGNQIQGRREGRPDISRGCGHAPLLIYLNCLPWPEWQSNI